MKIRTKRGREHGNSNRFDNLVMVCHPYKLEYINLYYNPGEFEPFINMNEDRYIAFSAIKSSVGRRRR